MLGNEFLNRQILSLAHQGGDAKEIADTLSLPIEDVKLILAAHDGSKSVIDRDITDEQLTALRMRAFELAMQGECVPVAARMTEFLIERDKPREKIMTSPITAINNALIVANDQFKSLLASYSKE